MIRRIWSDLKSFRTVDFRPGMNVILADQAKESSDTDSTNGLGKSTLIRIVHFCFGSDFSHETVLDHPQLKNVTFGLDFESPIVVFSVQRNTSRPKIVRVSDSVLEGMEVERENAENGTVEISLDDWKYVLSAKFFPEAAIGKRKFSPSFRDLAGYLIRLTKSAFVDPQTAFQNQKGAVKRLTVSFLLRLNWGVQRQIQEHTEAREQNRAASKALREAEKAGDEISIGDLEAMRVAAEVSLKRKKEEIDNFAVREDYRELESSLHLVDKSIHTLINENYSDRRLLDYYKDSAAETPDADPNRPIALLKDASAIFKDDALRNIEAVAKFHSEVYRNRKDFLQAEILRISKDIEVRSKGIDRSSDEKQRLLNILSETGAIDTLIEMQRAYTDMSATHGTLLARIDERKRFDRRDDELAAKISNVRTLLKTDLEDRQQSVDEIRVLFSEFTRILYGEPGRLSIDVGPAGYKFSFAIDREGSDGVDQMVVFCFDLAVASLWAKEKKGFGVLVHDSTLFADVDPRQYAAALKLAAAKSAEFGFQYCCCLNAGSLPAKYYGGFVLEDFVVLRLTDEKPEGRLLGTRLAPREKES